MEIRQVTSFCSTTEVAEYRYCRMLLYYIDQTALVLLYVFAVLSCTSIKNTMVR